MTEKSHDKPIGNAIVNWLWLLYVVFVIYGSLVPLRFVHRSLDDAIQMFRNIPFLVLGVESRADWIANGVLYLPVGFLSALVLMQALRKTSRFGFAVIAVVFSTVLAVAVEFTQLYFPPRTVSLNDLLAEGIGSLLGVALAVGYGHWFRTLLASFIGDSHHLKVRALEGYVLAYLAFTLFPFDFLVSWPELSAKVDSSGWGWLIAGSSPRPILLSLQLLAETVLTLPFGILLARLSGAQDVNYRRALLLGLLLGGLIEGVQFFTASGVSQGISVLTRALGVCGGLAWSLQGQRWTTDRLAFALRRYMPVIGGVYLLALLEINGFLTSSWHGFQGASEQFNQLSFVPFYYHYYTTEAKALFSLAAVFLSYSPIGLLAWARRRSVRLAITLALIIASSIEISKLFMVQSHPDLTNLLIACLASGWTARFVPKFLAKNRQPVASRQFIGAPEIPDVYEARSSNKLPFGLTLCLVAAGLWVWNFPAFPVVVGVVLIACAVAVWHHPVWVFAIIPAALPVFDLAPWSGRFFFDEFDVLLLVCLAVAYSRLPTMPRGRSKDGHLFSMVTSLVVASFVISTVIGLLPFTIPDENSFNSYFSHYNALRIGKGALWALLCYGLSVRFVEAGAEPRRVFARGLTVGLGLTVAVVVWERVAFSRFWNFSDGYRVTGPFSATHTGGAYLDGFLAAALPFLIVLTFEKRNWGTRLIGTSLILATTYALMVTFSRGGYLALGVSVVILFVITLLRANRRFRTSIVIAGLFSAMLMVALPIMKGEFVKSRLSTIGTDLDFRQANWKDSLNIRNPDWITAIFGMGLGRFPETKYWRSIRHPQVGTYRMEKEVGNTYLRLGSGDPIGVDQFVSLERGRSLVLQLDVRPSIPDTTLTIPICENWLLTSRNCVFPKFDLGHQFGAWRSVEIRIPASDFPDSSGHIQRPTKLSLTYIAPQSYIDIDNVRLLNENGANLVRNGDFAQGLDNWYMAAAGTLHAHWRVHSMYYGLLFDQGWFGVLALGGIIALAMIRAARSAWQGDAISGAAFAALSGFLVGGIFDTQIGAPRFLLLFFLLIWSCFHPILRHRSNMTKPAHPVVI